MADHRPADDDSILPAECLYIRIYPDEHSTIEVDGGGYRPTTGGIRGRDADAPLSVDLGSLCSPEETRDRGTNGNFHVAMLTAEHVRGHGLRIRRDPIVTGPILNPAHALIYGSRKDADGNLIGGVTSGEYSKLARAARIILFAPRTEEKVEPEAIPEQGQSEQQ
jgi:hypothetical protein